jgi:hypothetical protein
MLLVVSILLPMSFSLTDACKILEEGMGDKEKFQKYS